MSNRSSIFVEAVGRVVDDRMARRIDDRPDGQKGRRSAGLPLAAVHRRTEQVRIQVAVFRVVVLRQRRTSYPGSPHHRRPEADVEPDRFRLHRDVAQTKSTINRNNQLLGVFRLNWQYRSWITKRTAF